MTGERKAALALAALNGADRAWMLERLPEPRRERVASLLGELGEMRVSFDRELARQLVPPPREEAPATGYLQVLQGEPDWLVTLVLRARDWSWRDEFMKRGRRLAHDIPAAPPKLAAALVAALEAKVREAPLERVPPPARSFWKTRLLGRRNSWRR